jgi:hypothetical protein
MDRSPCLPSGKVEPDSNQLTIRTLPKDQSPSRNLETHLRADQTRLGGAEEDRTPDPLLAKQVLSQLSYSPIPWNPESVLKLWWAWVDSNYRPHPYQGCALTN